MYVIFRNMTAVVFVIPLQSTHLLSSADLQIQLIFEWCSPLYMQPFQLRTVPWLGVVL